MVSGLLLQVNFPETQSISDGAGKTLKHRGLHQLSGVPTLKGWLTLMILGAFPVLWDITDLLLKSN